jgi:hypothetical protein
LSRLGEKVYYITGTISWGEARTALLQVYSLPGACGPPKKGVSHLSVEARAGGIPPTLMMLVFFVVLMMLTIHRNGHNA